MKLVTHYIELSELQTYLDKYQDKIKFILPLIQTNKWKNGYCVIVDEKK